MIFGIIKYENCFITNNYWDLPKTKFHTEIKPYTKINMYNDPNTYLKLYKENMNLFLDYIQKESPNSQIILNPVRLGYKILKDDNNIEVNKNFKSNAKNTNKLLKKVDNILKKQKDVITLKIKKERILESTYENIIKAQQGNTEVLESLVKNNMGLVYNIAKRFVGRGYEIEDLNQIGAMGLVKSIKKFDTNYNVQLSTYAVPFIIGEIKRYIRDDGRIKVSRSIKELAVKINQIQKEAMDKNGEMLHKRS